MHKHFHRLGRTRYKVTLETYGSLVSRKLIRSSLSEAARTLQLRADLPLSETQNDPRTSQRILESNEGPLNDPGI